VDEGVKALKVTEPGVRCHFLEGDPKGSHYPSTHSSNLVNKGRFWPIYGIRSSPMNATGASGHLQSARK
jgi:hypothetical protein